MNDKQKLEIVTREMSDLADASGVVLQVNVPRYEELEVEAERLADQITAARQAEVDAVERQAKYAAIREAAKDPANVHEAFDDANPVAGHRDMIGDPFNGNDRYESAGETRQRAAAAIERTFDDADLAQAATNTLHRTEGDAVADHLILTSDPRYRSAFAKHLRDPQTGYQEFTSDEREAWGRVKGLQRAMGLSGSVLPSILDPTVVATGTSVISPMRQIARVEKTTANTKRFITADAVVSSLDGEAAEVSDDSPTLTEKTITVHKAQAFVPFSIEFGEDQVDWGSTLLELFTDSKALLEGVEFISGAGTAGPKGLWTALDGTASELSPATAETFVADDCYSTIEDLPVRWSRNAKWMAELSTLNAIRRFYNPSGSEPPLIEGNTMLGRPWAENSSVSAHSSINPAVTADNPILFVGDFRQYIVLDRVGMSIEIVQHLMGANERPTGQRGAYMYWRGGGDVLTSDAFRVCNVNTTL